MWVVKVVDIETSECVKRIPCKSERKAEKVESGVLSRTDLDKYAVETVEE